MSASAKRRKLSFFIIAFLLLACPADPARADDRMAGSVPQAAPPESKTLEKESAETTAEKETIVEEKTKEKPDLPTEAKAEAKAETKTETEVRPEEKRQTPVPPAITLPRNFRQIESSGPLTTAKSGGLGVDLWQGSDRKTITEFLPQIPPTAGFSTLRNLERRLLLTSADTGFLQGAIENPENDLLTLRMEKLNEIGEFAAAARLYTDSTDEPYHERFARAGILAMLYNNQYALACLEIKSLGTRFESPSFWQEMPVVCDYLLSKMGGPFEIEKDKLPQSKTIQRLLKDSRFRYDIKSAKSFENIDLLETALLIADRRMDYSDLKKLELDEMSPAVLAMLLRDDRVPEDIHFRLLLAAVERGMKSPADLAVFYKDIFSEISKSGKKIPTLEDIDGWRRYALLEYFMRKIKENGMSESSLLKGALDLSKKYSPTAALPFAGLAENANPEDFDGESVRNGIKILLLTQKKLPESWKKRWENLEKPSVKDSFIQLGIDLTHGFSTENTDHDNYVENLTKNMSEGSTQLVKLLYKRLDNSVKLHNSKGNGVYEKLPDLTSSDGYVMPSVGLMDSLKKALTGKRLGEVILLSSVALRGASPDGVYPELLREVLDGFEAVGLTKEARELSVETVLGLSK